MPAGGSGLLFGAAFGAFPVNEFFVLVVFGVHFFFAFGTSFFVGIL